MNGTIARVQAPRMLSVRNHLAFLDHLLDHADAGHREIVVSFAQTMWVDSSGLNALLTAHRHLAAEAGGGLRLDDVSEELGALFATTGLAASLHSPHSATDDAHG